MPLFLSVAERAAIGAARQTEPSRTFYWALVTRVERRAATPGLLPSATTVSWWHAAAEHLTDAAMAHALKPSPALAAWLRDATLSVARRSLDEWVGPAFRDHAATPPRGNLETAHLTWAVAVVLDLAADVFSPAEQTELRDALREKGLALCQRWLDAHHHLANWRCVLNAGVAVAAAVLDDAPACDRAATEFACGLAAFQPDGSSGESLQYGNYAAYALMLAREALLRRDPALALSVDPYARYPRWAAASLFYQKPLSGWGPRPRPRSANFNDSGALHRPSADLLLHLAVHAAETLPQEAGLARWLFDTLYDAESADTPHDRASFGFVNDFGFLTLPLLPRATAPLAPDAAGLPPVLGFSCGDVLARDAWAGRTILAVHGAAEPLHGPGHLHGDLNSFILVHNRERLLVDPGHNCYRNLIHELEGSSFTHNTCTFAVAADSSGPHLQEDALRSQTLQQSRRARRTLDPATGQLNPPVHRGGRRLLLARHDDVTVIASEIAALYGAPLTTFTRFWFLCGSHALFIVDRIVADRPVKTTWSWLLNNRDDQLNLKLFPPDRLVARRGNAGMKLFHLGGGALKHPLHAYVHDAYHPLPAQLGEGRPGSGALVRWIEPKPATARTVMHAIALDRPGAITGWHLKTTDDTTILESPGAAEAWQLTHASDASHFVLTVAVSQKTYTIAADTSGSWHLTAEPLPPM